MNEAQKIEMLRQQNLELAARLGVMETLTRAAFALVASYDGHPEARAKLVDGLFPLLQRETKSKEYQPAQIGQWLVAKESALLEKEFEAILEAIDEIRAVSQKDRKFQ